MVLVVVFGFVATAEDRATRISILQGAPFGLNDAAVEAVRSWRFRPGKRDGKPVAVRVSIKIAFELYSG